MIDIKQIQYFVTCVEYGSFSAAADILFTTQSNVSKGIKALEEEMDLKLFERHPRGVSLTSEGEHVYKYAVQIL
jgi:DNA-binding transcriptional LysR family regulator